MAIFGVCLFIILLGRSPVFSPVFVTLQAGVKADNQRNTTTACSFETVVRFGDRVLVQEGEILLFL